MHYNRSLQLYIDKTDGVSEWSLIDGNVRMLMGNIYGSTFNENIILGITYNLGFYTQSVIMSARELTSTAMNLLLLNVDYMFYDIGFSVYGLGFIYY